MPSDLTGARTRLETADGPVDRYSLQWLGDRTGTDIAGLPHTVQILLENLLRRAGSRDVDDDDVAALAGWPGPAKDIAFMPSRVLMQDFTGVPAVVDLAAMRSRDGSFGRRSRAREPARPGRSRDRPFRPGGPVPQRGCVRGEHRAGSTPQRRALLVASLVPTGVRRPARRAARRGHLPPGQPGASRPGGRRSATAWRSGHARRDRLAHDDDQRTRGPRMGGRRDRGRGGDARPADVPPAAGRRRGPGDRRAPRRDDGDRPRPHAHADAPRARGRRQVRRVLRRRPVDALRSPTARRWPTCVPSTARPPRCSRSTTRPCGTCGSPGRGAADLSSATRRSRVCSARDGDPRAGLLRSARSRPGERRAVDGRAKTPTGPRAAAGRVELLRGGVSRSPGAGPQARGGRQVRGRGDRRSRSTLRRAATSIRTPARPRWRSATARS